MTPPIAIIGAGPSGATLARLLEINDIGYVVFDRDCTGDLEGQGGSLDIHDISGQVALEEAGLLDNFKKVARYEDQSMKILDSQGRRIFVRDYDNGERRPEIDRKELRAILLSSVPKEKIRWNSRVRDVTRQQDGSTTIHFANGDVEKGFKLIVGADGAWSKVRSLITSAKPKYSGLRYLQTWISPTNPIYPTVKSQVGYGTCLAVGEGKQLVAQRMGDGTYNVYAGLRLPEEWSHDRAGPDEFNDRCHAFVEKEFSNWTPEVTKWIKQSDGKFRAWSLYAMPIESLSWEHVAGVTVIGDAAHVSTPFAGEGVNCAMYDSLQLARAIVNSGMQSLDEAVANYEKSMLHRGIDLITRSNENGVRMFADDAAQQLEAMFSGLSNEI